MGSTNILKDVLGDGVTQLNEDEVTALSDKLNTKLDALVEARAEAKIQFATEVAESEAKEKYDTLLKEHTDNFENSLEEISEQLKEKSEKFTADLQEQTEQAIATLTEEKEAEVEEFRNYIVERLDVYLDKEIKTLLPENHFEEKAKAEVLAPIVAGFKQVMEENYIPFDEENFSLLKEAKGELINTRKEVERVTEESLEMAKELSELKRQVKISKVCEGLTQDQSERAVRLLENCDVEDIEEKFSYIREDIIAGPTTVVTESNDQEVLEESVEGTEETSSVESHEGEAVIVTEDVNAPDELDIDAEEELYESVETPEVVKTDMDLYLENYKNLIK